MTDEVYDKVYQYLLEDNDLQDKTDRESVSITYHPPLSSNEANGSSFVSLSGIEGVNALVEDQTINFNERLTVIYGENGSGKSGYIRLLKKAFFSRDSKDEIIPNIHLASPKSISASFCFKISGNDTTLHYPNDREHGAFKCFSVFDNKCISVYLNEKNELLYRPSALLFFSKLCDVYRIINDRLKGDIDTFDKPNSFISHYLGDTEISKLISSLGPKSKEDALLKYVPYSEADGIEKRKLESQKAALMLQKTDTAIKDLVAVKSTLETVKGKIDGINKILSSQNFQSINEEIGDFTQKKEVANKEGIAIFDTTLISDIGSDEWKSFIRAADAFVKTQDGYPNEDSHCIYCWQRLPKESIDLIEKYKSFLVSRAEDDLKKAAQKFDARFVEYSAIKFDLLPEGSTIKKWLTENAQQSLIQMIDALSTQEKLLKTILEKIGKRTLITDNEMAFDISLIENIIAEIDSKITTLSQQNPTEEIAKVEAQILFYSHKEMLNREVDTIKRYIFDKQWADKAKKVSLSTKGITDTEKILSNKYYNSRYVDTFNAECAELNGNFGIEINSTGSAGKSEKKLQLKGKSPYQILSEGEQKVISLADFLAEIQMSTSNRGIIFDDPVTSLDNARKRTITERLLKEATKRQVVIFTHDLVFMSIISDIAGDNGLDVSFHWVEKRGDQPGYVWNNNSPAIDDHYTSNKIPNEYLTNAKSASQPQEIERYVKEGITAMRTCYEVLIMKDALCNTVTRFKDRLSIDRFKEIVLPVDLRDEIYEAYGLLCRYMEGHSHSDEYSSHIRPSTNNLKEEIDRYDALKKKIKDAKKPLKAVPQ
jgi:energy-coupling factor transporter ATP-binding protein EcfA2